MQTRTISLRLPGSKLSIPAHSRPSRAERRKRAALSFCLLAGLASQAALAGPRPKDELPPASGAPASPRPKIVPAILIKKDALFKPNPHLPAEVKAARVGSIVTGAYKLCIEKDGSIGSVQIVSSIPGADSFIIPTLKEWRFKPQAVPICFIQFLEFHIEGPPRPQPPPQ